MMPGTVAEIETKALKFTIRYGRSWRDMYLLEAKACINSFLHVSSMETFVSISLFNLKTR